MLNTIVTRIQNMESQKHRPLGVTIISILTAIGGIVFLASGAVTRCSWNRHYSFGIGNCVFCYGLWSVDR